MELLDPDLLLTADKSFAEFGPSLRRLSGDMRAVRIAYRDKMTRDAVQVGIGVGSAFTLGVLAELLSPMVGAARKLVGKIPKRLVVAVLAAFAVALARHVTHLRRTGPASETSHARDPSFAAFLLQEFGRSTLAGARAERFLSSIERPLGQARSTVAYAARVLSRSPGPVDLERLVTQMRAAGYRPRAREAGRAVYRQLRTRPHLFVRTKDGRWALRTHPAPGTGGNDRLTGGERVSTPRRRSARVAEES